MFVGGYQIIDLKEVAIDDVSGANIAGLYDKIEGADLKKPILLTGVNNDGTLLGDRFVTFTVSSSIFYAVLDTVYTGSGSLTSHILKVESDDDVSIISDSLSTNTYKGELNISHSSTVIVDVPFTITDVYYKLVDGLRTGKTIKFSFDYAPSSQATALETKRLYNAILPITYNAQGTTAYAYVDTYSEGDNVIILRLKMQASTVTLEKITAVAGS